MKKWLVLALIVLFTYSVVIFLSCQPELFSLDTLISNAITNLKGNNPEPSEKPDIKNYFNGDYFRIDQYLEDLGYFKVDFPKKEETASVFRYKNKKISISHRDRCRNTDLSDLCRFFQSVSGSGENTCRK